MAKITRVTARFFGIRLKEVLVDAMHGEHHVFEVITVEVVDADGATGVGYTFTGGHNGGAIFDIARRELPEIVIGMDADLIEAIWNKVWWVTHYGGKGGPTVLALSALDTALWDLKAKKAGQPLYKALGGFRDRVSCYAGGIDLHLSPDELIEQTEGNLKRGFRAIKMKVGRDVLAEDVAKVRAMREHLGEGFPLMVDANMKWTVAQGIEAARAFAPYAPKWFEEPCIPDDLEGMARIADILPLAVGENCRTIWEFKHLLTVGKVAYPEPDVTNCGGVTPFMKIAHMAEAFNLPVTSHGAHDITVHLLCAVPNGEMLEAHGFGLDDYIETPLKIEDGMAIAPDVPGHGVVFDFDGLKALERT